MTNSNRASVPCCVRDGGRFDVSGSTDDLVLLFFRMMDGSWDAIDVLATVDGSSASLGTTQESLISGFERPEFFRLAISGVLRS